MRRCRDFLYSLWPHTCIASPISTIPHWTGEREGKLKVTQSCLTLCNPYGLYSPWNSPGQNTGVGSLSLPQRIFLTQGSNPGLSHCRQILYQQSHKGSPRILEWVAYPFSSGSSWPRNRTRIPCIAGRFLYRLSYDIGWIDESTLTGNHLVIHLRTLLVLYVVCMRVSVVGHVQLLATWWTAACQAPLSMGFSRQEY